MSSSVMVVFENVGVVHYPADLDTALLVDGTLEPLLADLRALDHVLSKEDARFHLEAL